MSDVTGAIVWVPDAGVAHELWRLNRDYRLPGINLSEHSPHVTLYQGPSWVVDQIVQSEIPARLAKALVPRDMLRFGPLETVEPGWVFATVLDDAGVLQAFHDEMLSLVPDLGLNGNRPGYTPEQQAAYARNGYRYAGDEYRPHFTLARYPAGEEPVIPEGAAKVYQRRLEGSPLARMSGSEAGMVVRCGVVGNGQITDISRYWWV